jgi:hypothetical protein
MKLTFFQRVDLACRVLFASSSVEEAEDEITIDHRALSDVAKMWAAARDDAAGAHEDMHNAIGSGDNVAALRYAKHCIAISDAAAKAASSANGISAEAMCVLDQLAEARDAIHGSRQEIGTAVACAFIHVMTAPEDAGAGT